MDHQQTAEELLAEANERLATIGPGAPYSDTRQLLDGIGLAVAMAAVHTQLAALPARGPVPAADVGWVAPSEVDAGLQIDRLAEFISANVPGEPSRSESAVDTAILVITNLQNEIAVLGRCDAARLPGVVCEKRVGHDGPHRDGSGWNWGRGSE